MLGNLCRYLPDYFLEKVDGVKTGTHLFRDNKTNSPLIYYIFVGTTRRLAAR